MATQTSTPNSATTPTSTENRHEDLLGSGDDPALDNAAVDDGQGGADALGEPDIGGGEEGRSRDGAEEPVDKRRSPIGERGP